MNDPQRGNLVGLEPAAWSRAMHMVGTPRKTVVLLSRISSSAAAASKRGISATQAPREIAGFITPDWPRTWESGAAPKTTSPGIQSQQRPGQRTRPSRRSPSWVSSAPFGSPVVPDV